MSPTLSVVMPVFNGERYIGAALESIRQQAPLDLEVIVVDDGSSDSTLAIVRGFEQKIPVRCLTPGRLGNWVAATNIGLRESKGEWVCFLHHDDVWLPGRIARLRPLLQDRGHTLILHNALFIGPHGETLGAWTCPLAEGTVSPDQVLERLLVQNFIAMPTPVFRRNSALAVGGLDEALWHSADWDYWLRLVSSGPTYFIGETLTGFRVHPSSQTAARRTGPGEWEKQLSMVVDRHLPHWTATGRRRTRVKRMAAVSIAVNSALAAKSRGEAVPFSPILRKALALGPLGCAQYLRISRIFERVAARLRVKKPQSAKRLGAASAPVGSSVQGSEAQCR